MHEQAYTIQSLLLVDDDNDDCDVFCSAVASIAPAVKVECVSDGRQFLHLRHHVPDLLFFDLEMP